jgi:hypothetical protein
MKHKLVSGILVAWCCVGSAQQAPQKAEVAPLFSEQDKRMLVQISRLKQKIERLECEIETQEKKIDSLTDQMSAPAQTSVPSLSVANPKVARVLNINGQVIVANVGVRGGGLKVGDKIFYVRRKGYTLQWTGQGTVFRAYKDDAECDVTENVGGIRPEDEIYVSNRICSPYSVTHVQFRP